jgi:UDP:flavonoid glycosyltransferase YjiC (YdhE family)
LNVDNDKVIAFITHAGLNSITEAFHSATPVISIPLFGDQMRNAKMIENRQIGVIVDKKNLSSQSIIDAIEIIINDNRLANYKYIIDTK